MVRPFLQIFLHVCFRLVTSPKWLSNAVHACELDDNIMPMYYIFSQRESHLTHINGSHKLIYFEMGCLRTRAC